jgi:hypothetical protein
MHGEEGKINTPRIARQFQQSRLLLTQLLYTLFVRAQRLNTTCTCDSRAPSLEPACCGGFACCTTLLDRGRAHAQFYANEVRSRRFLRSFIRRFTFQTTVIAIHTRVSAKSCAEYLTTVNHRLRAQNTCCIMEFGNSYKAALYLSS